MIEQVAKVSRGYGGDGFTPRREETRQISLGGYYARQGDRKAGKVTPYAVGDIVRAGVAKGWLVTELLECSCSNCEQWVRPNPEGDCLNECGKRGFRG
jgi:hypothetical protein